MTGMFINITFAKHNVWYIAINDNFDTQNQNSVDNNFAGIRMWFNEFYARDTSRKIRAVNKAKGERGERLTVNAPYGYRKNPENKKEVYGNQASHDKFFAVTVKITNAAPNASYAVSLNDDADANTHDGYALATSGTNNATIAANEGKTNPTTVTANASGVIEQTFYLQHGNWVVVRGLPQNAVYTVTENAEDYRPTPAAVTNYKNAVIGTMSEKDLISDADGSTAVEADGLVSTSFLNTRTGVSILSTAPSASSMRFARSA